MSGQNVLMNVKMSLAPQVKMFLCPQSKWPHVNKNCSQTFVYNQHHTLLICNDGVAGNRAVASQVIFSLHRQCNFFKTVTSPVYGGGYTNRPFHLTCAIACVSTSANLSVHAICRRREKSYSAEKVLFHRIFFFQSFVYV